MTTAPSGHTLTRILRAFRLFIDNDTDIPHIGSCQTPH